MDSLFIITAAGLVALTLCFLMLWQEMQMREADAGAMLHTDFVHLRGVLKPEVLHSTHIVIGRRKRRCDIDLSGLHDMNVSKTHAILWWDGDGYRIAPIYSRRIDGTESRPQVWVNDQPAAPHVGLPVEYGDTITLSSSRHKFTLKNTQAGGEQHEKKPLLFA